MLRFSRIPIGSLRTPGFETQNPDATHTHKHTHIHTHTHTHTQIHTRMHACTQNVHIHKSSLSTSVTQSLCYHGNPGLCGHRASPVFEDPEDGRGEARRRLLWKPLVASARLLTPGGVTVKHTAAVVLCTCLQCACVCE